MAALRKSSLGIINPGKGRSLSVVSGDEHRKKSGLTVAQSAFFMTAQMAGAGFLALPRAMADSGWFGIIMLFAFCGSIGFIATRLGLSWVMLEERYREYRKPAPQPYIEVAYRSLGLLGRKITVALIIITNIGGSTVFLILISELVNSVYDNLSTCEYVLIVAAVVIPLTWFGTPKDFWQGPVFAVASTLIAVVIIIVEIFLNYVSEPVWPEATHPMPTFPSFALGFGAILFAFGGMSVFPTIQNDMQDRTRFWKSIVISFSGIVSMYFPVALFGYMYIGDSVDGNVILSLKSSPAVTVAIVFQVFNLLLTTIITLSPVFQSLEVFFHIPSKFGLKRVLLRSCVILGEVVIALAFPDFGLVVNLIGGSSMCCLSFILPPVMYMKLVDDKSNKEWPQRSIPLWQRIFLWEVCFLGIIGGISSTASSLYQLLRPEQFEKSCFSHFGV